MERTPATVWSGSFRVFGVDVKCHVLEDGQRVIEEKSAHELAAVMECGASTDDGEILAFARWVRGE